MGIPAHGISCPANRARSLYFSNMLETVLFLLSLSESMTVEHNLSLPVHRHYVFSSKKYLLSLPYV